MLKRRVVSNRSVDQKILQKVSFDQMFCQRDENCENPNQIQSFVLKYNYNINKLLF